MFDLQLDNIKTGAVICIIKPDGTTNNIYRVGEYSKLHGKYRYKSVITGRDVGLIPTDGIGHYAMHARDKPHFFFSANPEHIAKAYRTIEEQTKRKKEKEQADKAALKELYAKIDMLLSDYNAHIGVSLEGNTHGVVAELYLSIGQQAVAIG